MSDTFSGGSWTLELQPQPPPRTAGASDEMPGVAPALESGLPEPDSPEETRGRAPPSLRLGFLVRTQGMSPTSGQNEDTVSRAR